MLTAFNQTKFKPVNSNIPLHDDISTYSAICIKASVIRTNGRKSCDYRAERHQTFRLLHSLQTIFTTTRMPFVQKKNKSNQSQIYKNIESHCRVWKQHCHEARLGRKFLNFAF